MADENQGNEDPVLPRPDEHNETEEPQDSPFENTSASQQNLDVVLSIPVRLSMEVGSTSISIRRLLQLNRGSVVELNRVAGEPLEVYVNGTLIAHGEVVLVNEKFGIRFSDVMSPEKRIESLN